MLITNDNDALCAEYVGGNCTALAVQFTQSQRVKGLGQWALTLAEKFTLQ